MTKGCGKAVDLVMFGVDRLGGVHAPMGSR
jgi:hypothetical protein